MRTHRILYFSADEKHRELFHQWARKRKDCPQLVEVDGTVTWHSHSLPEILASQEELDNLYVIIDYLSLFSSREELEAAADMVRHTILQFPEVDFLFDQSGVKQDELSGLDFLQLDKKYISEVLQSFHIFRCNDKYPFFFCKLDYDNLFDGTRLRWAVREGQYDQLNTGRRNYEKLQNSRKDNLALVVDDEPKQARFNGAALYFSGYRVIPVHTARMLLAISKGISNDTHKMLEPKIILRDFDLQFPDVLEKKDYYDNTFYDAPELTADTIKWDNQTIASIDSFHQMIDYVRNYRYEKKVKEGCSKWTIGNSKNLFWSVVKEKLPVFIITNGHNDSKLQDKLISAPDKKSYKPMSCDESAKNRLLMAGMQKPISGLYHAFFTHLKDDEGSHIIQETFEETRYDESDGFQYEIDKRRKNSSHGIPVDIFNIVSEMLSRAERYYQKHCFVKSAVLSEEIIELLNGFHHQMMIRAYHIKSKAENAIAMDVIGANEGELVLDACLRIQLMKQDIHRMLFPMYKSKNLIEQYRRRKKEHQLLKHIFSDCRKDCRDNEYFGVESTFVGAMAHLDQRAFGIEDLYQYYKHCCLLNEIEQHEKEEHEK